MYTHTYPHTSQYVRFSPVFLSTTRSENGSHPICPHPALSFTINARPPQGYMYYFAYGMDMNPDRYVIYIINNQTIERKDN